VFHVSIWGALSFVWGAKPPKAPRCDRTVTFVVFVLLQRTFFYYDTEKDLYKRMSAND